MNTGVSDYVSLCYTASLVAGENPVKRKAGRIIKKLTVMIMTTVLALAAPALASAATGLTEGGVLIAVGKEVRVTNVGSLVFTSTKTGNQTCGSWTIAAKVTSNSSSEVAGVGVGEGTASSCSVPGGGSLTVTNIKLNAISTKGEGKATASLSFKLDFPSGVTCSFTGSAIPITYNPTETTEGGDKLTIAGAPLSVTPAACGTTTLLDSVFTLETNVSGVHPVHLM